MNFKSRATMNGHGTDNSYERVRSITYAKAALHLASNMGAWS